MERQSIKYDEYTTEELLRMKRSEAVEGLNEQQQRFCEAYVYSHNVKSASLKAGYEPDTRIGLALRKKPSVKRYIQWIKARCLDDALVSGRDIIEQWAKIAFADITDVVDILPTSIRLKPSDRIDGQLVKSVRSGRDGVQIELHDKMRALENLAKYTEDMPKDFRQILDTRKQELLEQEFELKKKLSDIGNPEEEDDGFLEALKKSSSSVWEDHEEE